MIVALDVGTTTVSGVLWDAATGTVVRVARRRNDAALPAGRPTRAEQDPARLRALALEVLAELAAGAAVEGIALTGQKHGLLVAGVSGEALTPLISWQDRRTAEPLSPASLEAMRGRVADLDWQANGCRLQHGYGAATLFWLVQTGALPAAAERVATAAGWVAGQLCGQAPVTDPTFAASWGIYDLRRGTWNGAFVERLGLPARLLPAVLPAGQALHGLAPLPARTAGLPAGLPIFNAVGDTQASFLGSVRTPESTILVNLGTGGQVCWLVPGWEPASETVETRPLPHGRYLRVGASLCGGAAYGWLNRTVRAWLAEFGLEPDEQAIYERMNALAALDWQKQGAADQGLKVRTTFLGVRGRAVQGGAIEGITLDNLTLGALARATLAGLVDELRDLYRAHAGPKAGQTGIVAAGGAVEHNPLLPEILARRFGLPVQVSRQHEAAATGAAMLAVL